VHYEVVEGKTSEITVQNAGSLLIAPAAK